MPLSKLILTVVSLGLINSGEPNATKSQDFNKVDVLTLSETDVFNHDVNISRTQFDQEIDDMIFDRLGEDYRRANVYDFYPNKVVEDMSIKDKIEMLDYYDYCRKELTKLSQAQLLKVIKKDLDLDGKNDYAVLVHNHKKEKNYLAIINFQDKLYLEPFKEDYLELVNSGYYPTSIVDRKGKTKQATSPALKLVSFEPDHNKVIFFDRKKKVWQEIEVSL